MHGFRSLYLIPAALVVTGAIAQTVHAQDDCSASRCSGTGVSYAGGVNDDFAPPEDPATPRAPFLSWSQSQGAMISGFDQAQIDHWFIHSFTGLPTTICAATMTIRLKPLGGSNNDGLALQFDENTNTFGWSEVIQTLAGVSWNAPQPPVILVLDLGCLPPDGLGRTSVLPQMNATGHLDVRVQDDTAVDYITLDVCYDCPPVPVEASTWGGIKALYSTAE